jgi:hypothetical protein
LREPTVATVTATSYSTLIGKFVNDAKRQIEDAFAWNVLGTTITITTSNGSYSYALTGSGQKFQVIDVLNTTSNIGMKNIDFASMNRKQNLSAHFKFYVFNGNLFFFIIQMINKLIPADIKHHVEGNALI